MSDEAVECECDWTYHQGRACITPVYFSGGVSWSPALCVPCLHTCEGEREELADGGFVRAVSDE